MLPPTGLPPADVQRLLDLAGQDDQPWRDARGWSLVYDLEGAHAEVIAHALAQYASENALSSSTFPSAARFESAVIAMVASATGSPGASGVFTSGGTESILLALKAFRDSEGDGTELVVPTTAHPAFGKAAQLLGLTVVPVPVETAHGVDPAAMRAAITPRTLALVASAPSFPYGAVDPVAELGAIALEAGLRLHVDAAVGGMFLPFLEDPQPFGVDVPGVSSVSVDLHKYGYGAKGASVLLFADPELRRASYYVDEHWPGGAYAAAGVLGTRSVGPAAAAFASLVSLGQDGYRARVAEVLQLSGRIQSALGVLGTPPTGVFAVPDAGGLAAGLTQRGWWVDAMPGAVHFVVFPRHAKAIDALLADAPLSYGATGDAASYGVMVRGEADLGSHLDRRFDLEGGPWW